MEWIQLHPKATPEMLGFIPEFLNENDPRPAREQLDDNYSHGGGVIPIPGFELLPNGDLKYPGDPPLAPLAETRLRDEIIRVYHYSWVVIIQPDGSFIVARMN
jgi:hypothetical protein